MRRSKITDELVQLSKLAKELGFPQDVEEGDWFLIQDNDYKSGYSSPKLCEFFENNPNNVLILSFSRCLKWLEEKNKGMMIGLDLNNFIRGHWIMVIKTKTYRGRNIHEVGAKAIVMKLEEKNA